MPTKKKAATPAETVKRSATPVTKVGNLTSNPELRFGDSGKPYCRMRLACNVPVKPGDWSGERKTDYYDVTAFGSLAENAAESLRKGVRIVVVGKPETRTFTGSDGMEKTGKAILADALGPDLRWSTVIVTRQQSRNESTDEAEDF